MSGYVGMDVGRKRSQVVWVPKVGRRLLSCEFAGGVIRPR